VAEKYLYERLAEVNDRLSRLQQSNDPSEAEEFIRLYQERLEILKKLDLESVRPDLSGVIP
jgi:uncharacterized protein YdcH (DUF465 family)